MQIKRILLYKISNYKQEKKLLILMNPKKAYLQLKNSMRLTRIMLKKLKK